MKRNSIKLLILSACFVTMVLFASCNFVYIKKLSKMPKIYEKMTVYGLSHIESFKPESLRLTEGASSNDARSIAASIISGMYFKYKKSDKKTPFDTTGYRQTAWAEMNNFEIKHRDLLKTSTSSFMITQAEVNLLYDMDEKNYKALQSGIPYETIVKVQADDLLSLNQVVSKGIMQVIEDIYGEKTDMVDGTAWVINVSPKLVTDGIVSDEVNRYLENSGNLVPAGSSSSIEFQIQLVLKKGYVPEDTSVVNPGSSDRLTEISDFVMADETNPNEFAAPGFAIATTSEDRTDAKKSAKVRCLEFIKFTTQGFEFSPEIGIVPRKDREEIEKPDYEYSTERLPGNLGIFCIGQADATVKPFEEPVPPPARYRINQVFPMNDKDKLAIIFDKLPLLLANIARARNGRTTGMGYFGKNFQWRVYLDQKDGIYKFQIICDVYIHSTIKPKN